MDFLEELLEHSEQSWVVLRAKNLEEKEEEEEEEGMVRVDDCLWNEHGIESGHLAFVTNHPPFLRRSQDSFKALRVSRAWEKASWTQAAPTLGAPSWRTQSTFHVCSSLCRSYKRKKRKFTNKGSSCYLFCNW